jgi:hypothetical protein
MLGQRKLRVEVFKPLETLERERKGDQLISDEKQSRKANRNGNQRENSPIYRQDYSRRSDRDTDYDR